MRSLLRIACIAAMCLPAMAVPSAPLTAVLFTSTHPSMGTEFKLEMYARSQQEADEISTEVFDEVDRLNDQLSNYSEASELSRINREAPVHPVVTDPETFGFLRTSLAWSERSDGAFDITVGALMKEWGFFRHRGRVPTDAELEHLRRDVGWPHVQLDDRSRSVFFNAPHLELDPGGIGKGFAIDACVAILRAHGVSAALISAGSSTIYAVGAPPGERGWKVVLTGPVPSQDNLSTVFLRDTSISSANCSEKHFVSGGHDYCHIMDPRTMRPVEGRVQVSVIDPSATDTDALSNVVFVESPAESLATLAKFAPQARALIVSDAPVAGGSGRDICTRFRWEAPVSNSHCEVR